MSYKSLPMTQRQFDWLKEKSELYGVPQYILVKRSIQYYSLSGYEDDTEIRADLGSGTLKNVDVTRAMELPDDLSDWVDNTAEKHDVTKGYVMRKALKLYMDEGLVRDEMVG